MPVRVEERNVITSFNTIKKTGCRCFASTAKVMNDAVLFDLNRSSHTLNENQTPCRLAFYNLHYYANFSLHPALSTPALSTK